SFAEASPRKVDVQTAQKIQKAMAGSCQLVDVFQDAELSDALRIVEETGIDIVQLHGIETPEYSSEFKVPVIKVFNLDFVKGYDPLEYLTLYLDCCDFVMFDKPKGIVAPDWLNRATDALAEVEKDLPGYFLAGGLTPENLENVLLSLHPY